MRFDENDMKLMAIATHSMMNHPPHRVFRIVSELIRDSRALSKLAVKECNELLSGREERKKQSLRTRISSNASEFGAKAYCFGDPRGYVVKLDVETGDTNELSGKWGVA